jgi:hypothetical protein
MRERRKSGTNPRSWVNRQPIMTAYRQQALACVYALASGPARVRELRAAAPDAGKILLRNVYGWFERTGRGTYRLTPVGETALRRWPREAEIVVQASDFSGIDEAVMTVASG